MKRNVQVAHFARDYDRVQPFLLMLCGNCMNMMAYRRLLQIIITFLWKLVGSEH
jgi:hypothetical protein